MKLYCPECSSVYEEDLDVCPEDGTRLYSLEKDSDDPLIGSIIDERFRIDALIGEGGMGTVYRGVQLSVNREVAIKVLRTELLDKEVALERFFREAKIISGLTHPNIVRLVEFGQDRERDLLYLVMEMVAGQNLGDLLMRGRFRPNFALEVVYQVCGALTEPHRLGVIHRDLKPDNLLLVPISDGTIQTKVLDFGIARALETNTQLTATGMVCGTPAYMAPEQAQNQEMTPRTDLYALGVIFYEMLTGQPPFTGSNSLQIMIAQIQKRARPVGELLDSEILPEGVEDLVEHLLQKDPGARPDSAREVRDRIEEIQRNHDLDPVRIDPDEDADVIYDDFYLPRVSLDRLADIGDSPRPADFAFMPENRLDTGDAHSPPIETGDAHAAALAATAAQQSASGDPTLPVQPEKRVEIMADSRRGQGATDLGPAQAWTPGPTPEVDAPLGPEPAADSPAHQDTDQRPEDLGDESSSALLPDSSADPSPSPEASGAATGAMNRPREIEDSGAESSSNQSERDADALSAPPPGVTQTAPRATEPQTSNKTLMAVLLVLVGLIVAGTATVIYFISRPDDGAALASTNAPDVTAEPPAGPSETTAASPDPAAARGGGASPAPSHDDTAPAEDPGASDSVPSHESDDTSSGQIADGDEGAGEGSTETAPEPPRDRRTSATRTARTERAPSADGAERSSGTASRRAEDIATRETASSDHTEDSAPTAEKSATESVEAASSSSEETASEATEPPSETASSETASNETSETETPPSKPDTPESGAESASAKSSSSGEKKRDTLGEMLGDDPEESGSEVESDKLERSLDTLIDEVE